MKRRIQYKYIFTFFLLVFILVIIFKKCLFDGKPNNRLEKTYKMTTRSVQENLSNSISSYVDGVKNTSFIGDVLYDSNVVQNYENIPVAEIEKNTRIFSVLIADDDSDHHYIQMNNKLDYLKNVLFESRWLPFIQTSNLTNIECDSDSTTQVGLNQQRNDQDFYMDDFFSDNRSIDLEEYIINLENDFINVRPDNKENRITENVNFDNDFKQLYNEDKNMQPIVINYCLNILKKVILSFFFLKNVQKGM
ncbi:hypothetical protein EDEG_04049 [Edhazardia aedis USNM 41457]|uniref:Uncharacterized protein n=1 Tax=Edhazardia aedis (strain USNM 41457) TaxID=1003232 RepID=J9D037_EDHAE|nr:hypothetical protein EDEG_04049 [Edhazardia aedis USNM 41457]|eukprot:EJW01231.1 hypothetical protein EDEG_04049 [Edhazardia aedis USNM 41457]